MQEPGPVVAVCDSDPSASGYHVRMDRQDCLRVNPQPRDLLRIVYYHLKTPLRPLKALLSGTKNVCN